MGLRVHLLETVVDVILGNGAMELALAGLRSRRLVRRELIKVCLTEPDVYDITWHDYGDWRRLLADVPQGLLAIVQTKVVEEADRLALEARSDEVGAVAASSSTAAGEHPVGLPPPFNQQAPNLQ